MIVVIDYGVGNIGSVIKAFNYLDIKVKLSSNKEDIKNAEAIILPGVGAFGSGMKKLEERGLKDLIIKEVQEGKALLGICLGLQLLFTESEESPSVRGLDLIKGKVKKFNNKEVAKIPHMGWNSLEKKKDIELFKNIEKPYDFYFIHSYYVESYEDNIVMAETQYGDKKFASLIKKDNIWGIQPHPEKSSNKCLEFLKNFAKKFAK